MLTLNQTVEILKNFTSKHKALNSFYFGDKWEVGASDTVQYPLLWCALLDSSVSSNLVSYRFQIDISDKVNLDESNETHVLSDCQQICLDLLNYLEQISDNEEIGITASKDATFTDYTEDRDDMVSGWFFEVTINSHIYNNSCNLPIVGGSILDGNYIYVGGNTTGTTCAFLVEIKDQNGNVIQSFTTSGTYNVEVLQEVIDTIIGNTATIIDPIN